MILVPEGGGGEWNEFAAHRERLSIFQGFVFPWEAFILGDHQPVIFSTLQLWNGQMRRETSFGDRGAKILRKPENPSSDPLEASVLRELSTRDD